MNRFVGWAALFVLVAGMAVGRADEKPPHKEPTTDKEFVLMAIAVDLAEIRMGERAMKLAASKEVKRFARKMIDEHTKHRKRLMKLAKSLDWEILLGMLQEDQDELERLNKLTGNAFDAEYMKTMATGHAKALKMYEKWEKEAEKDDVREMAKKTTPVVREHLAMALKLKGNLAAR